MRFLYSARSVGDVRGRKRASTDEADEGSDGSTAESSLSIIQIDFFCSLIAIHISIYVIVFACPPR